MSVKYCDQIIGEYFADLIVEDQVICELKAVDVLKKAWIAKRPLQTVPIMVQLLRHSFLQNYSRRYNTVSHQPGCGTIEPVINVKLIL